jgi:hypothetical protein
MKFTSPTNMPVCLGLTSGHMCVVPPAGEYGEVPSRFRRLAIAEGCLPEGVAPEEAAPAATDETKITMISAAIRKLVNDPKSGDFLADGRPNAARLSSLTGFTVLAAERDTAWTQVSDEMDAEEAAAEAKRKAAAAVK